MNSKKSVYFILLGFALMVAILVPTSLHAQAASSRVTVNITGIRSSKGKIEVRLWSGKNGFPKDDTKAFRRATVDIVNGTAKATFADVPFGEYAVSAFHDENSNGKMDTRFPGIPIEGVGVSNDPHKKFGPPAFGSCRFSIGEPEKVIPVAIEY
jgi:uncharacterized protein (DUF2141 family)